MKGGVLGIGLMILLGVACSSASRGPSPEGVGPAPVLSELDGVEQFKARFNEDGGMPRVVLLMSPT